MTLAIIAQLEQLISEVEASGPVAEADARIDISTHSKSGYKYARLRSGNNLSACGRVGSEPYLEALATLHRRDKIAQIRQAIESLKRANEMPVAVSESDPALEIAPAIPKAKSAPVARKKQAEGRQQLYTHVRTKQGSLTHAVLGKDEIGEWRTAALCGAKPPQRDRLGWEFPDLDDGVSCYKCYRKLPANGKRYFPKFD